MLSEPVGPGTEGVVPLSVPEIGGNEWKYVKECLDTNWVSSVGSFVDRFESDLAAYVGTQYAVATVNGTAALHIALLVAGVEAEDEVLVSDLTFIAPVNAIRYVGAWPVFVDAEPHYWQMDPGKLEHFLETGCSWSDVGLVNKTTGRRVKAILPVHILGHPCDVDPIMDLARKYDLAVIEDATESLGARYKGRMVGHLGHVACFSFNGNKIITTGGGGMVVTDNNEWAERARYLTTQAKDDTVEYIHNEIGYNYRLTNIQAAMGVAQLERLEEFVAKKRAIAEVYERSLRDLEGITVMPTRSSDQATYWLYTVLLGPGTSLETRQAAIKSLNDRGIGARPLWHPIHSLPPYLHCQALQIEHSVDLYQRAISLPSSVGLDARDLQRCASAISELVN